MSRHPQEITLKRKLEETQRFKISRFKEAIKRTQPHKHDAYLELIFLSEGAGFHWVDTRKYQLHPPHVFLLSGQLHYWEMTSVPRGYVLLFREGFFDPLKHHDLQHLITTLVNRVEIRLASAAPVEPLLQEIEREYTHPALHTDDVIRSLLHILLIHLLRHQEEARTVPQKQTQVIFNRFLQYVAASHPVTNVKVHQAARHLGLSPQYLNSICRKNTGKNASEIIREQVILEAKRYLLHSGKTISEIAFLLNFSDPSHFVKYFRKAEGRTPQSFRTAYIQ